jgi:hypothetical protein
VGGGGAFSGTTTGNQFTLTSPKLPGVVFSGTFNSTTMNGTYTGTPTQQGVNITQNGTFTLTRH